MRHQQEVAQWASRIPQPFEPFVVTGARLDQRLGVLAALGAELPYQPQAVVEIADQRPDADQLAGAAERKDVQAAAAWFGDGPPGHSGPTVPLRKTVARATRGQFLPLLAQEREIGSRSEHLHFGQSGS